VTQLQRAARQHEYVQPVQNKLLHRGRSFGKGNRSRDFLGFTFYWTRTRTRRGRWAMRYKTRSASLRRIIGSVYDWCRRHRHSSVKEQHAALKRRIQGHFNYWRRPTGGGDDLASPAKNVEESLTPSASMQPVGTGGKEDEGAQSRRPSTCPKRHRRVLDDQAVSSCGQGNGPEHIVRFL
jgi:hypothetical protein